MQAHRHTHTAQQGHTIRQKSHLRLATDMFDVSLPTAAGGQTYLSNMRNHDIETFVFLWSFKNRNNSDGRCDTIKRRTGFDIEKVRDWHRWFGWQMWIRREDWHIFLIDSGLTLLFWISLRMCSKQLLLRKTACRAGLSEHCRISGTAAKIDNKWEGDSSYLLDTIDFWSLFWFRDLQLCEKESTPSFSSVSNSELFRNVRWGRVYLYSLFHTTV